VNKQKLIPLIIPAILLLCDLGWDKASKISGWLWCDWKVYLVGWITSLSGWLLIYLALGAMGRFAESSLGAAITRYGVALISGFALALTLGVSHCYLGEYHHLPNVHVLEYMLREHQNAWAMFQDTITLSVFVILIIATLAFTVIQLTASTVVFRKWRLWVLPMRVASLFLLLVVFCGIGGMAFGWHRFQAPLPIDTNWARAIYQYALMQSGNRTNLQEPHRLVLKGFEYKQPWNAVVIINESLRADALLPVQGLDGSLSADSLAPRMQSIFKDSQTTVFNRAWSNSGATNVSVPSIITGVPPEGSSYDFHRNPTLLTMAHEAGLMTAVITCQDWKWEHFDEFFLGRHVDYVVTRRSFNRPRDNDLGIADGLILDSLRTFVAKATALKKPFLVVLQFNGTHYPYYAGPKTDLEAGSRARYDKAVSYIDSVNAMVHEILREQDILEQTFVFGTADHGENLRSRNLGRLASYFDEAMRVPMWVRFPREALNSPAREQQWKSLQTWKAHPVQNLDIAPTVYDFLGLLDQPVLQGRLLGVSLLRPPQDTLRVISGQNTCEIRSWHFEGIYAMRGHTKFLMSNTNGASLFDLNQDPGEKCNLWNNSQYRKTQLPWVKNHLSAMVGREALCKRLEENCPEELRH